MSVSRKAVRLIATCVATGALVGAAAMPALGGGRGAATVGAGWGVDDR
ncbi:hypothetical protein [Streptomyces mirabilis]